MAGAIAGAAITASKRPAWNYAGVGAGVVIGGGIGYLGGALIIRRTVARLIEQREAEQAAVPTV